MSTVPSCLLLELLGVEVRRGAWVPAFSLAFKAGSPKDMSVRDSFRSNFGKSVRYEPLGSASLRLDVGLAGFIWLTATVPKIQEGG